MYVTWKYSLGYRFSQIGCKDTTKNANTQASEHFFAKWIDSSIEAVSLLLVGNLLALAMSVPSKYDKTLHQYTLHPPPRPFDS